MDDYNTVSMNNFDIQMDNEKQRFLILDKISILYDKVFKSFQNGENFIYNPNMFSYLTKDIFTNWVIDSNPDLKNIFNKSNSNNHVRV